MVFRGWSWKGCFSVTLGKTHVNCLGLSWDRAHGVNTVGLLRRWFCKGCSSLTKEVSVYSFKPPGSQGLVTDIGEPFHFSGLLGDRACQINMIGLLGRLSLKGHSLVTLVKPWLCTFIVQVSLETALWAVNAGRQSFESVCFSGKMVMKNWSFVALAKPWICTFIVQVSWVNPIVWVTRWF